MELNYPFFSIIDSDEDNLLSLSEWESSYLLPGNNSMRYGDLFNFYSRHLSAISTDQIVIPDHNNDLEDSISASENDTESSLSTSL